MFFTSILYLAFVLTPDENTLPAGEGKAIVQQKCISCHTLKVITAKKASRPQWSTTVDQMITRGADVSDDDVEILVDYLAKNFGPAKGQAGADEGHERRGLINVNSATAAELAAALDLSVTESTSIVSYRERNGNFKEWRDVTKVPGIDAKKIESNKDRLVF